MRKFVHSKGTAKNRQRKILGLTVVVLLALLVGSAVVVRKSYSDNLQPLSNSQESIVVTIEPGSVPGQIADNLKSKGLIKADWAFEWYVRNHNLRDQLKAGTYVLMPSQSVPEIVDKIISGKIATDLVTVLPGKRIEQIRQDLIDSGFTAKEVDKALDPDQYAGHPALTDKPRGASLEGYLYPESFQKTAETTPGQVIKLSLDEMADRLTPELRQALAEKGLSLHQAITMASIIEQEVSNEEDRATVAQVFLKRYKIGMKLQSDATNAYAKINPDYDTYKHEGLPPGPISNVSEESLQALAYPAQTDWLYFVSGDDGRTYFSKTLEEHEKLVDQHCTELCGN